MALAATRKLTDGTLEKSGTPSQTLYLQNLPEKLQKYDLKRALYMLFSTYGPVLDIIALKTAKMRGQAHVVFRDVPAATQAMRHCQGFEFFGRNMKISYAKTKSQAIARLTGVFQENDSPSSKQTAGQQQGQTASSFPAPPGTLPGPPAGLPPPPGLSQPSKGLQPPPSQAAPPNAPSPSGTKRTRDESEDEDGEPMDEDDDSGGEMDMSDDD